ncbi:MAG: 30S ribosome-binding factor RbfA [bacterium]|nr:30S ribosome-binding factor RbfA [bacterium]
MPYKRAERVSALIKKEISDIIQRKIKDPRVGLVSITHVWVSKDLRLAKVYVSIYGNEHDVREGTSCLKNCSSFIRQELGKRIRLRYIPEICFIYDPSIMESIRISEIIRSLKEK